MLCQSFVVHVRYVYSPVGIMHVIAHLYDANTQARQDFQTVAVLWLILVYKHKAELGIKRPKPLEESAYIRENNIIKFVEHI